MTWVSPPASEGRGPRRWGAVALALLLIAVGCLALGLRGRHEAPAVPPHSAVAGARKHPGSHRAHRPTHGPSAQPLTRSTPVALRIPAIDVSASLAELGLNPDWTVEVPTNFQEPGWYRIGPAPGELGSAVILGHVDSYRGPAIFFRLRSLKAGDRIEVSLADGMVAQFAVTAVETYPKAEFPAQQVYAPHGDSALQLVTCGGQFDSRQRSYLSNVVAYSTLVGATTAAASSRPPAVG